MTEADSPGSAGRRRGILGIVLLVLAVLVLALPLVELVLRYFARVLLDLPEFGWGLYPAGAAQAGPMTIAVLGPPLAGTAAGLLIARSRPGRRRLPWIAGGLLLGGVLAFVLGSLLFPVTIVMVT